MQLVPLHPGYYRYDASGSAAAGEVVMAAQVMGEWSLATIGAPGRVGTPGFQIDYVCLTCQACI
jgi:hypothetical protein